MHPSKPRVLVSALCAALAATVAHGAGTQRVVFNQPVSTHAWSLAELNPELPGDWSAFDFLVVEFRASSSQRFELGLKTAEGVISKRIHPFANVWVRASIPLRFFREGLGDANDLAATVNQPRLSYWINIEAGGHGPTTDIRGLQVIMRYPVGAPTLEIRSVALAKSDPGDDILEGKPLMDPFGQYAHAEWTGKAHSEVELKQAWTAEAKALASGGAFHDRDSYGGFMATKVRASGFFRVEQVDGRWWFVTPDGHLFFSVGVNGIGTGSGTRTNGREDYFASIPPPRPPPPGARPNRFGPLASFYTSNLERRHGADYRAAWAEHTSHRLAAWRLNTSYGPTLNDAVASAALKKPYVFTVRGWQNEGTIMGMPDVYADEFARRVEAEVSRQLAPRKDDPWLVGYFIGNEPPWPERESQLVDLVLAGPPTKMQERFRAELAKKRYTGKPTPDGARGVRALPRDHQHDGQKT